MPRKPKTIMLDFTAELDNWDKDWICPSCRKTYKVALAQFWDGLTEQFVCETCVES